MYDRLNPIWWCQLQTLSLNRVSVYPVKTNGLVNLNPSLQIAFSAIFPKLSEIQMSWLALNCYLLYHCKDTSLTSLKSQGEVYSELSLRRAPLRALPIVRFKEVSSLYLVTYSVYRYNKTTEKRRARTRNTSCPPYRGVLLGESWINVFAGSLSFYLKECGVQFTSD